MPYLRTISAVPLDGFQVLVTFANGERRLFDLTPYLDHGVFRELRDPALFNSVRPAFDTIEWANGADIAPETLYQQSQRVQEPASAAEEPARYGLE